MQPVSNSWLYRLCVVLTVLVWVGLTVANCSRKPNTNTAAPAAAVPVAPHQEAVSAPAPPPPLPEPTRAMMERQQKAEAVEALNEKLLSMAQTQSDPGDTVLGMGDLLQIEVFEAEDLTTKARVSSRGFITVPLLGQLKVDGMTAREAEMYIEDLYRKKYIKDPHVSIFVQEHFSQRVTLVGQFKSPGTYDLVSRQRLLDVMALGGGVTEKAGRIVQIRRRGIVPGPDDETPRDGVIYVDMDKLVREGKTELNIEVNGGDVLFVPEAGLYFVDGAVRRPGSYPLQQRTTLQEAVVAAGGLAPYAQNEVTVFRLEGGERVEHVYDTTSLENWNVLVEDQDVIVAESDGLRKFWYGFRFSFFGVGYADPER
jgi:polysaccharide biosynthesis/export protein